jgi:hypothetical protein
MKRAALAGLAGFLVLTSGAAAQLVPVSTCHAALPCSIPYGLRPADSVQNLGNANGGPGNTALSLGLHDNMKIQLIKPISDDPSEYAARLFVRKNPQLVKPTPAPTPAAAPAAH